ncbi:MAG: nitroreductase family protein [Pirellulaceae bacterium]
MTLKDLLHRSRSYRRFHQEPLEENTLIELLQLTRLCPSASNRQPLKYLLAWQPEQNDKIFPQLRWAAALAPWPGPAEGERPTGYIVILGDTTVWRRWDWDCAIAGQVILMGATERGLGGCMIASIEHAALASALNLPGHLDILMVIALGKPGETVVLEDGSPDDRPYWRDANSVHHVPKRALSEVRIELPGF